MAIGPSARSSTNGIQAALISIFPSVNSNFFQIHFFLLQNVPMQVQWRKVLEGHDDRAPAAEEGQPG